MRLRDWVIAFKSNDIPSCCGNRTAAPPVVPTELPLHRVVPTQVQLRETYKLPGVLCQLKCGRTVRGSWFLPPR